MSGSKLLDAAIEYARMGWSVLALQPRLKEPATASGLKDATTDLEQIKMWWSVFPDSNVGVSLGTAAGNMIAIDIDVDEESGEDGWETMRIWEQEHGKLPETCSDVSGRGGGRLYYIVNRPVSNSTNKELGVDIRGESGYAVMPPSIHPNGREYTWEVPPSEVPPAFADENVYAFLDYVQGRVAGSGCAGSVALRQKFELPSGRIGKGKRNDTIFRYTCRLQADGLSDEEIVAIVNGINQTKCDPPLSVEELQQIISSVLQRYEKGKKSKAEIEQAPESVDASVIVFPFVTKSGEPKNTLVNYIALVENDANLAGHFRYNTLDHSVYVVGGVPWDRDCGTRRIKDSDYANMRAYCERQGLPSSSANVDDVIKIEAENNEFSPIVDWLRALPPWDGIPRISTLLHDFLGANQSPLTDWAMHNFMWGCVARAERPGTKYDFMLIFVGEQGIGKSLFIRRLAVEPDWFDDNFSVILGETANERINGLWIAEMPELTALKRTKEVEQIKAFLTTTVDSIRPKYAKNVERRPRVCCFIGTTNQAEFLTDHTGNRRFIPINLFGTADPAYELANEEFCREHFMQCWAEALWEWDNKATSSQTFYKVSLNMPREMAEYIDEIRETHEEDAPLEGIINEWLSSLPLSNEYVCAIQIAREALELENNQIPQKLINDIRDIVSANKDWVACGKQKVEGYGVQRAFKRR